MLAQEKAHQASELSQTVVESSKFGETSSQKNFDTFDQIHSDMGIVADAIDRLNEQAESVGDIIAHRERPRRTIEPALGERLDRGREGRRVRQGLHGRWRRRSRAWP